MSYATLKTEIEDGILILTLNRPDHLNAFSVEMSHELEAFFRWASEADEVRAVVVTGAGRAFCAGMDLERPGNAFGLDETQAPTLRHMRERLDDPVVRDGVRDTGGRVTLAIHDCLKPVIAAINGPAVGIGATMTLAMDARLASDKARIGLVFGRLGITPEACSTWFLPRIVGLSQALEWTYAADILDAEEARRGGLVRSVHPADELLAEAVKLARRFVDGRSPVSVALIRQMMLRNSALADPAQAHEVESLAMFYTSIGDGKEGVRAFKEKRPPTFQARASQMPPFYPWWK